MRTTKPLFFLVLAIYPLVTLHSALMQGYFVDGMIYASLARNLAEGYGSFWDMRFSEELFTHFREHPPLGIYIQSLFYRVFGDTEFIDKFYGFFIGFGILGLIAAIYRRIQGDIGGSWLALLAFLLFPLSGYVLSYNWLEHILTLCIMAASLAAIVALQARGAWPAVAASALAGALIFAGVMIKGPTAIYPLALPLFAWLLLDGVDLRRAVLSLVTMLLALGLCVALFILPSEVAMAFFRDYIDNQVIGSLSGERSVHARTKLLESLLSEELIAPLVVFALLVWYDKTGWSRIRPDRRFWFFLAMALSGSLPLMLIPKQNDYYLFISMPFYALALASLFEPLRQSLQARVKSGKRLYLASLAVLLLAVGVMFSKQGEYRKDAAYHKSFSDVGIEIPARSMISACPESRFFSDWNIAANLQRYYRATLSRESGHEYILTTEESVSQCVDSARYTRVSKKETPYLLYRRN